MFSEHQSPVHYVVRHITHFRYSAPIAENVMEVRMQPLTDAGQNCLHFDLTVQPRAALLTYQDSWGNTVHHFGIPRHHRRLLIQMTAHVQVYPRPPLPDALPAAAWDAVDALADELWHFRHPSHFTQPTALLAALADELGVRRDADPLTVLRRLNTQIATTFAYAQATTRVDSPIDEALATRRGVCQDFTHIMLALVRGLGIPCRYVSGYLFRGARDDGGRSAEDASHAWIEAFLPGLEWVGFDPTNNLVVDARHIRVATGRDYADVPPTRGVFKGRADSELSVGVHVGLADVPLPEDETFVHVEAWSESDEPVSPVSAWQHQQQQQQ